MNRCLIGALLCASIMGLNSRDGLSQKPTHEKKTFVSAGDTIFWNRYLPVYLKMAESESEAGTWLNINGQDRDHTAPIYFSREGVNYIRMKLKINDQSEAMKFAVYADGQPPVSTAQYLGANRHERNGVIYLGKGLSIRLTSRDDVSGVEQIHYAVNKADFQIYDNEVRFEVSGEQQICYYAVDRVGNDEKVLEKKFVVDLAPPITEFKVAGDSINSAYSFGAELTFQSIDSLAGMQSIYYKIDDQAYQVYNGQAISLDPLGDGDHLLQYYAEDHVGNQETAKEFEFFFDRTAPLVATDILGDRFIVGDEIYFSGRTKLKFTAVDNKVGVKEVKYSINNEPYEVYDQPFYLPSASGTHAIQYFAVDHLNNKTSDKKTATGLHEFEHTTAKVYVDLIGPNLAFDITGQSLFTRDTLFINKETKILLKAYDSESGLQKITYSLEGSSEEFDYEEPLSLVERGYHAIDFYGYDNVNNRNLSHLNVFMDVIGPEIYHYFSSVSYKRTEDGVPVFNRHVSVYLAATDDHTGLKHLSYRVNGGPEQMYGQRITGFKPDQKHVISITAIDLLGNQVTDQVEFYCRDQAVIQP